MVVRDMSRLGIILCLLPVVFFVLISAFSETADTATAQATNNAATISAGK